MLSKILYSISQKLPCRLIDHNRAPYLERFLVATILGKRIYLHRFVASDPDGLHDHPFERAFSFILSGWYQEDRWSCRYTRRWINKIGPNDFHRVVLPNNGRDVWTLFVHSTRVKPWGFLRKTDSTADGAVLEYSPESCKEDPAFSDWSKDRCGKEVRKAANRQIPPGQNAYAVGLLGYPRKDLTFTRQNQQ